MTKEEAIKNAETQYKLDFNLGAQYHSHLIKIGVLDLLDEVKLPTAEKTSWVLSFDGELTPLKDFTPVEGEDHQVYLFPSTMNRFEVYKELVKSLL